MADTVYVPVFAARQDFNVAFWLSDKRRFSGVKLLTVGWMTVPPEMAIPFGAFAAAVEIKCGYLMFGVCVAGKVRFGQHDETGDTAFFGKLVPVSVADGF